MTARFDAPVPPVLDDTALEDLRCTAPAASRIMTSLACSCALHLLVLFSPVFGTDARSGSPSSQDSRKAPTSLSVTLPPSPIITVQDWQLPASGLVAPDLPVPAAGPATKAPSTPSANRADASDLLPLPAAVYYPTSLLSVRPQPLGEADLDPPHLRPIVASGKVRLTVWIKPSGEVLKVAVEATDLPQMFVDAAVGAFERLRFQPGEFNGLRVGVVMRIEITYDDGRMLKMEIAS
jgi:hypothetical protein